MSRKSLRALENLAGEEQQLYIDVRRERIKQQNVVRYIAAAWQPWCL